MKKIVVEKFEPIMVDPSLLCTVEFWETSANLRDVIPKLYFPINIRNIKESDFHDFYGGYRREVLSVEEVFGRSREALHSFSWEEYSGQIPQKLSGNFEIFVSRLRESHLSKQLQGALLDEFVFLCTRSSIISRLKKTFKLFEKLQATRLINLEEEAPEEWRETVKGIKNAISLVNWIASLGGFSISLGIFGTAVVEGIRLFLIDPT